MELMFSNSPQLYVAEVVTPQFQKTGQFTLSFS